MVEVKKRKVEEGDHAEEVSPSKKSKKRNTFSVVDVYEEEKDFLKLSRSQVVEEDGDGAGKKKKKKRKSAKNKPAINLAALGGISSIVDEEKVDITGNAVEKEQLKKGSGNKSQQAAKEKAVHKKTVNEKTEKIKEKKQKNKVNKNVKELNDKAKVESKTESSGNASDVIETEGDKEEDVSEWKKLFVCEALVSALEKKGFKTPTPIQRLTLPAAIKVKLSSE